MSEDWEIVHQTLSANLSGDDVRFVWRTCSSSMQLPSYCAVPERFFSSVHKALRFLNSQGKALYQVFVKKDEQRLTIQSTDTSCSLLLQKSTCYKRLYYNNSLYTTDHDERTLLHYKSQVHRNPFDNDEFPIHYDYSLCEWCSRLY